MAGQHSGAPHYTPTASQDWRPLGFREFRVRATQGQEDYRVPVKSNQFPAAAPATFAGLQLRQPLSLLSQRYNISFAASVGAPYQPQVVQLATNNTGTGLGLGKLKNLNVNKKPAPTNLLARATRFGRYANRIPVS